MKFIPNGISTAAARTILKTQKTSPQTLFVAGLVGMGATIFLACKATLKVEDVLDEHEDLKTRRENYIRSGLPNPESERKAQTRIALHTAGDLARLYGPAVVCGTLSVAALAGSHNILTKRNAALAAAYGVIEKSFNEYRARIKDAYGEDREKEIYHNVLPCEETDEVTGKTVKRKMADGSSPYSFLFTPQNKNWSANPEYNFLFLRLQQASANQRLQARGHLFLNELLDDLGFEHTKAGAVTGWVKGQGDDYIDFGIFNEELEDVVVDFMRGREKELWLNFNVDGTIFDKI